MIPRQSLSRRIIISFVLMTLVVAGLFSLSVVMSISFTEQSYASSSMSRELDDVLHALEKGLPFNLDQDMMLYVRGSDGQPPLPAWLGEPRPGFSEIDRDGKEFHVFTLKENDTLYVLTEDPADFEARENTLLAIVAIAFVLSVLSASVLGTLMARRVIAPVIRLSDQVQQGDQLLQAAPRLAAGYPPDEVGRLAAAFDATLGQLRQALERERFFTSDVSHELRTPLMVIASSCDLMRAQGLADPRQEALIRRIQAACAEMQEQVDTFLRLSRSGDSHDEADVRLDVLAAEQIDRLHPEAAARGLELSLSREGESGDTHCAPLLRAVLSNLLRNAIHYTDHGFVRLVLRSNGFSVIDSGVGIPPEERESVFRPFVRGDASRGDGHGLGLSLVQRICERQGWRIHLGENPGGGCEFRVDFSVTGQ